MKHAHVFLSIALILSGLFSVLTGCRSSGTPTPSPAGSFTVTNGTLVSCQSSEREVTLPEEVIQIGSGAFTGAPGLTRITLGAAVEEIHPMAFSGLHSLQSVEVSPKNPYFRVRHHKCSDCTFLCSISDPTVFCFPGACHTVDLCCDTDAVPYFHGENTEIKLACQGAVFHLYRHTDNDEVRRWYCRAIRWQKQVLEFQEAEEFSGGNYQTSIFSTNSGDVVFQRSGGGSADAWLLTCDGWTELSSADQPDGIVTLYPGEDGSLRYRKIPRKYAELEQLSWLPPEADGDDLYCEEGAVSLAGGNLSFTADTQQTVSEYWALRDSAG